MVNTYLVQVTIKPGGSGIWKPKKASFTNRRDIFDLYMHFRNTLMEAYSLQETLGGSERYGTSEPENMYYHFWDTLKA